MNARIVLSFAVAAAVLAPAADAENRCDGNACAYVSNRWDGRHQIFHNAHPSDSVTVKVDGVWTGSATMHIGPRSDQTSVFQAFRLPYHANLDHPPAPHPPPPVPYVPPSGTMVSFFNGSGRRLWIHRAVSPPNSTVSCSALQPVDAIDPQKTATYLVPSGMIAWFRFQTAPGDACSSVNTKFENHTAGTPQRTNVTVNVL